MRVLFKSCIIYLYFQIKIPKIKVVKTNLESLSQQEVHEVFQKMKEAGMLDMKNDSGFYLLKYSYYELADAILAWARKNVYQNKIQTLKFIV